MTENEQKLTQAVLTLTETIERLQTGHERAEVAIRDELQRGFDERDHDRQREIDSTDRMLRESQDDVRRLEHHVESLTADLRSWGANRSEKLRGELVQLVERNRREHRKPDPRAGRHVAWQPPEARA